MTAWGKQSSRSVPTRKKKYTTYIIPALAEKISQLARSERRTDSQMIANLVEDGLIARGLVTREEIEQLTEEFKQGGEES
jgi:predicted transcriptional regulator